MKFPALLLILISFSAAHARNARNVRHVPRRPAAVSISPIQQRLNYAKGRLQAGDYSRVIQALNAYTDQLPEDGLLMLSQAFSKSKKYSEEVRVLKLLVGHNDRNFKSQMLLAQALLKQANAETHEDKAKDLRTEAIQDLRKCLKLRPKFKPAFDQLVDVLLEQKEHSEARELLLDGIKRYGKLPDLLQEICRIDSLDGYLSQAIENCRAAISAKPLYPDSYVYLVQSLHDQNKNDLAAKEIEHAAGRFPKSEFVQWAAGKIYFKSKNYPVATRYFSQAVKADPSSGRAMYGLARSLFESHQPEKALTYFQKSCSLVEGARETFFESGARLFQKGDLVLSNQYKSAANACRYKVQ